MNEGVKVSLPLTRYRGADGSDHILIRLNLIRQCRLSAVGEEEGSNIEGVVVEDIMVPDIMLGDPVTVCSR